MFSDWLLVITDDDDADADDAGAEVEGGGAIQPGAFVDLDDFIANGLNGLQVRLGLTVLQDSGLLCWMLELRFCFS